MWTERIKVIFFDLDNTLFDHTRAEKAALQQLIQSDLSIFASVNETQFLRLYHKYNSALWKQLSEGKISGDELRVRRFELVLREFGIDNHNFSELSTQYMAIYGAQAFTLPGTMEILLYLAPRYELGILSNGFTETQKRKLANIGIDSYFRYAVFSSDVGALKPSEKIFEAAQRLTSATTENILYVGDSYEYDILSAKAAGWKTVYYNPAKKSICNNVTDAEIFGLMELSELL